MDLTLIHQATRRLFRGRRGGPAGGHAFGGAAEYAGLTAFPGQPAAHLLLLLDTADPAVGVRLPAARWLPLLCAVRYGACGLGYRVASDREVRILDQVERRAWDGFPYDGYPDRLPASPIVLEGQRFDPADSDDAFAYAGIFGYGSLAPEQFEALARRVERDGLLDVFGWETGEDYLREGNCLPYLQGLPTEDCPEPSCVNHGRGSSLRTFAIFREENREQARYLWGPDCGGLQIVYQICPACSAIRASNQSS